MNVAPANQSQAGSCEYMPVLCC